MTFESMKKTGITTTTTTDTKFSVGGHAHDFYISIVDGCMIALAVDLGTEMMYLVQGYIANSTYREYARDLHETLYTRFGVIMKNGSIRFPVDAHIIH